MFGLHQIANRRNKDGGRHFHLVPLDWWENEDQPLPLHLPAVVGRDKDCGVRLHDPWVSRIHCELCERNRELMVRDLESKHGVYVNEKRVLQAPLHCGDVLTLGVSRFRVECDDKNSE